jgi:Flp pilus assembly protein TadG
VELAICLPLIFVIIFASIEACDLIFLKQKLTASAYEGALVAVQQDSTEAQVEERILDVLQARGVSGASVSIDGPSATLEQTPAGQLFTILVESPTATNLGGIRLFVRYDTLSAQVAAHRQ